MSTPTPTPTPNQPPAPCPFCAGRVLRAEELDVRSWAIVCQTCSTIGPLTTGQDALTALTRWNHRPRAGFRATDIAEHITLGDKT